jgi:hypothetical protein
LGSMDAGDLFRLAGRATGLGHLRTMLLTVLTAVMGSHGSRAGVAN